MENFPDIPGFRVIKELGRGGIARVYLAFEEKLQRQVALKVLSRALSEEAAIGQRFLKEARTGARLRHSHIAAIYDIGQAGDIYYFTMEYLEESLRERLAASAGGMPPSEALMIVRQLAAALAYAHEEGLVHRDIKPENIFFRQDGTAVLTDFAITGSLDADSRLSKTGLSLSSPYYLSPEKINGEILDGRADVYGLGVVLYEMLTGRVPYEGANIVQVSIKHLQQLIPRLPQPLRPYQPLVEAMMAKEREERLQNGRELLDQIQPYLDSGAPGRQSPQGPPRQPQPMVGLLILVPLAALIIFVLFFRPILREKETKTEAEIRQTQAQQVDGPKEKEISPAETDGQSPLEEEEDPALEFRNVTRVQMPRCIRRVQPDYPLAALQARVQGRVVIDALTDIHGNVVRTRVVSGHALLTRAALDAVKQWKYQPYLINQIPKPVVFTVTLDFRLSDQPGETEADRDPDTGENRP